MFKKILITLFKNIRRNKTHIVFSSVGIIIGTALFTFFVSLVSGIKENVLNKLYPVNQVEIERKRITLLGFKKSISGEEGIDLETIEKLKSIRHVVSVFPKQKSKFQSKIWGGKNVFGRTAYFEAFFDGISPELVISELKENELQGERSGEKFKKKKSCKGNDDCDEWETCKKGKCEDVYFYTYFKDFGNVQYCKSDNNCRKGESCINGECKKRCEHDSECGSNGICLNNGCEKKCSKNSDCGITFTCENGVCRKLACFLEKPKDQFKSFDKTKGYLVDNPKFTCPQESYCATPSIKENKGYCEMPIPVIINPFILTIYNTTAAVSLNLPKISGKKLVLGLRFRILYGNSFFVRDVPPDQQIVRQCVIVGFSTKALELGITMPLGYVERINAKFKGPEAATVFDSVILVADKNQNIPFIVEKIKKMGFDLTSKSKNAYKAGNMLYILALVFSIISIIILIVAAINITHNFLMIVYERKREIAILRSLGARKLHIRLLFLLEALFIGFTGGILGNALSVGAAIFLNNTLKAYIKSVPFIPDNFFTFHFEHFVISIFMGIVFCLIGSFIPANRASKLDPALILSGDN